MYRVESHSRLSAAVLHQSSSIHPLPLHTPLSSHPDLVNFEAIQSHTCLRASTEQSLGSASQLTTLEPGDGIKFRYREMR